MMFPRIYSALETLWDYPEFDAYISSLILDSRNPPRKGFPPEVVAELLKISSELPRTDIWGKGRYL